MRQAIIWTNADRIHWRICAALGGDKLTGQMPWRPTQCPNKTPYRKISIRNINTDLAPSRLCEIVSYEMFKQALVDMGKKDCPELQQNTPNRNNVHDPVHDFGMYPTMIIYKDIKISCHMVTEFSQIKITHG